MKTVRSLLCILTAGTALLICAQIAKAHPYASGVTNNAGTIQFILNEGGGDVKVVFEDTTTNAMGVLAKGLQSFPLGAHTSYSIYVTKTGNGTPSLITTDTDQFAIWNSPRGVDINKNAKFGHLFGRTYVGNSTNGGVVPNNKGIGLYALNADLTDSPLGRGTNASASATFGPAIAGGIVGSGPWRLRVSDDNTVLVVDASPSKAGLWQFASDLNSSNQVLANIGTNAATASKVHGQMFGTAKTTGSLAAGNLVLYTGDCGLSIPTGTTVGPNTFVGDYNVMYRYDIGAGPLPWASSPNYAYSVGLGSIAYLRGAEVEIGADGKIILGFGRANLSNGNIQILDPTGTTVLYNSLHDGADLWNGLRGNNSQVGTYAGVRVSPDGRFLASVDINNAITIGTLTNGIPDESSIFGIPNTPALGNARGMCWDAANNLYVNSSGQGLLRGYSLGLSTTAITSNDSTGTNGTFQLVLPPINASVVPTTPLASQNYINNVTPGTPIPGVFTVSLTTNVLTEAVTVGFTMSGTAIVNTNYTINTGTDGNGVIVTTNTVTFPIGTSPSGNWSKAILITPTAIPVIGPTLTSIMTLRGGANYLAAPPISGSVSIANTGPQLLILSAAASGTTMNRGIPGDYAKFLITRLGDTNGPGNSPGNVTPASYTVTNFIYTGTAAPFPTDYTAAAQNLPISGIPVDGTPGIVINPGKVIFTNIIGNPVIHANLNIPPTNVTVIITLTNSAGTNLTSLEGSSYSVSNNAVTLTELDNTVGPETVLWSNPLTNAADSVNWTLTFATTNLGTTTVLPVVLPNYTNGAPESLNGGGSNNFEVTFGSPVASYSVPPSPVMAANGWDKALRMTVNKDFSFQAPSAVNVYPQGQLFQGNYALRFNMFLSLYSGTIDNPVANTLGNEFALFGINHRGTNCNWKPTTPVTLATGGSGTTNSDGMWMAVDAGAGSITPADYDGFAGQPLPNNGSIEPISATAVSQSGVFKRPPFVGADTAAHRAGGTPVNKWVDVSIEVTRQTNLSLFIARSQVLASYAVTNGYTNGTFMLGYLDPLKDVSDPASAFVYYSNVRVIELSPYITNRAISLIVTQGANVSFTSSATYATAPVTNQWYRGTTVPVTLLQTDSNNDTNITSTLSFSNVGTNVATNYYAVFRDVAGSVTGLVATLEVVPPPPNVVTNPGATALIKVIPVGPAPPTSYQWRTNGVNLVNGTHYAGVTTSNLLITNAQAADAITYSVVVSNASGGVEVFTTLTLANVPSSAVVSPANQTNLWGSSATFTVSASGTPPFTYRWKTNGVNLVDGSHYSGATNVTLTVSNITTADAVNYTVGVTNAVGSTLSTVGTLTVFIPAPTFAPGAVSLVGSDVVMSFGSTNIYDGTNAFTLQSSAVVEGPYTNTPATFTTSGGGTFQVTTPQAGGNVFYRLMHKN